jgi:cell division protein ZapA
MREIARNSSTADSVKVAVLAALNIADELQRLKNQTQEADAHLAQRSAQYAQLLDGVLRSLNSLELAEASQPAEQAA